MIMILYIAIFVKKLNLHSIFFFFLFLNINKKKKKKTFFRYLFSLNEPNAMSILDLKQQESILLLTPMPLSSERWLGQRRSFEYYRQEYNVHEVDAIQHIHDILQKRKIKYL